MSQSGSYNNRFYSPSQYDQDQKDMLISQLKAEIFEMKQNERDFNELNQHLKNLEHRYTILNEEKIRNEAEQRNKNDHNLRIIANLRTDVDSLKQQLTEKTIDLSELRAENSALKDISEHRSKDIQRLKNDCGNQNDLNQSILKENQIKEREILLQKEERLRLLDEIDMLTQNCDTLLQKNEELERLIKEYEIDLNQQESQNLQLVNRLEQNEVELRNNNETIRFNNQQLQDARLHVAQLQQDIQSSEKQKDKLKLEINQLQKNLATETNKTYELNGKCLSLENYLKQKDNIIEDFSREIEGLKQAHSDSLELNELITNELDAYKKNYEILVAQNQDLLLELEQFSEQDEQVRFILNRKTRVKEIRFRADGILKNNYKDLLRNSPSKFTGNKQA